jgi:hypothetical protein
MEPEQLTFEAADARSLLDHLIADSQLYKTTKGYKELLEFVVRLRNFAPFNAMLLQLQKPGLTYAASAHDWRERFGRTPKEGARPLLILWPFGPVALVYDVQDTEGRDLPTDVACFLARGAITDVDISAFLSRLATKHIETLTIDAGDASAGSIQMKHRSERKGEASHYRILLNRNHNAPVRFATLAHELGHLFLGHLGPDRALNVPKRSPLSHAEQELEAESVTYIVCARNGVASKSESYLNRYVTQHTTVHDIDLYQIMRAAGQVEAVFGLGLPTKFQPPTARQERFTTHTDSGNASDGARPAVDILPLLKAKYSQYLRSEITAVTFAQTNDRCFLEIRTLEPAGRLLDEVVKCNDLSFVTDGEGDTPFFDPSQPIGINVTRFIDEFDEVSIINCTDLFSDAAAAVIQNCRRE